MIKNTLGNYRSAFRNKFIGSLLLFVLGYVSLSTHATEYKGMGEANYSMFLDKDERREAENAALKSVIERWITVEQQAHFRNYEKVKKQINSNIKDYILDYTIIDETKDSDKKRFSVVVRATLNEPKLMALLLSSSEQAVGEDQAYITFVFVAREIAARQTQTEQSTSKTKSQGQGIAKDVKQDQADRFKSQTDTISLKKGNTISSDTLLWRVTTANEIDVAMGNVFTEANFLVIDASLLEEETNYLLEVKNFIQDYQQGNDLTSATKRDALKGLKNLQDPIHYLAIGTLDIDEQLVDDKTGQIKIPVSVTGQVLAVQKRGAAVAKVGPIQYFGLGPTITVAKNNALKLAAEDAARNLVAILSTKNIR